MLLTHCMDLIQRESEIGMKSTKLLRTSQKKILHKELRGIEQYRRYTMISLKLQLKEP